MVILPPRENNLWFCTFHPLNEGQPVPMFKTSVMGKESLCLKREILHCTIDEACDLSSCTVNSYESCSNPDYTLKLQMIHLRNKTVLCSF